MNTSLIDLYKAFKKRHKLVHNGGFLQLEVLYRIVVKIL